MNNQRFNKLMNGRQWAAPGFRFAIDSAPGCCYERYVFSEGTRPVKTNLSPLISATSQGSTALPSSFIPQRLCRRISASWIPLLLLMVPAAVEAQFNYTTNNGTITIT